MAIGFIVVGALLFFGCVLELVLAWRMHLPQMAKHRLRVSAVVSFVMAVAVLGTGKLNSYYGQQLRAIESARAAAATTRASDMMDTVFTDTMNTFASNIMSLNNETQKLNTKFRAAATARPGASVMVGGLHYTDATRAVRAVIRSENKLVNQIVQTDANLNTNYATMVQNLTDNSRAQFGTMRTRLNAANQLTKLMLHYHGNWQNHQQLYTNYSNALFY